MVDFCNTTDAITLDYELDLVLQQLDMLFDTNPQEVLGELNYGTDFDRFLYELNYSNDYIASYIEQSIRRNIEAFDYDINVNVKLLNGTENDIILVIVHI